MISNPTPIRTITLQFRSRAAIDSVIGISWVMRATASATWSINSPCTRNGANSNPVPANSSCSIDKCQGRVG